MRFLDSGLASNLTATISGDGYGGVKLRNSAGFGTLFSPASVSVERKTTHNCAQTTQSL